MYELCGYRYVDMTDGGKKIEGFSCWFLVEEADEGFHGRSACKVFFPSDRYLDFDPVIGDQYLLIFNQKGKLQGYQKMDTDVLEDE